LKDIVGEHVHLHLSVAGVFGVFTSLRWVPFSDNERHMFQGFPLCEQREFLSLCRFFPHCTTIWHQTRGCIA